MEQILLAYGIPKETVAAITSLYRNTKVKVRLPDGDTEYFDIVATLPNLMDHVEYSNFKIKTGDSAIHMQKEVFVLTVYIFIAVPRKNEERGRPRNG